MATTLKKVLVFLFISKTCLAFTREHDLALDYKTAEQLSTLPLECYNKQFPYKLTEVLNSTDDLQLPKLTHPIFYGCFDWHSSVHGHWLLAALLRKFPDTPLAEKIAAVFDEQFQVDKSDKEVKVFNDDKGFERTYGWSWFLKLHQELKSLGKLDEEHNWSKNTQTIADKIVELYKNFLPKLAYPIRVGEHTNIAFGLAFAYEYAKYVKDSDLIDIIVHNVTHHYANDAGCPLSWEPSGYDFLSPCLQEADLMSRFAADGHVTDFNKWFQSFLPEFQDEKFVLEPGKVNDRTDGKLVHLDGLNFSRAYNLYSLIINLKTSKTTSEDELNKLKRRLLSMGDSHVRQSLEYVVGSDYAGSHWLATFVTYALQLREEAMKHIQS